MMTSLLPPNATGLARALEDTLALDQRLTDIEALTRAKPAAIEPYLPWLLWEYGLAELARWLPDPRRALIDGIQFQRIRGTPAAWRMALGWTGLADSVLEERQPGHPIHAYTFLLDPGQVLDRDQARAVVELARLAAPARSRLVRIFHGWDRRALWLDTGRLDRDWWDDWSGVDQDGVRQSFGTFHPSALVRPAPAKAAGTVTMHALATWRDRAARWDRWPLDGWAEPRLLHAALLAVQAHHGHRPTPPPPMPHGWRLPRAALVDSAEIDALNAVYDGYAIIDQDPDALRLDAGLRLDGPPGWRWRAINALTLAPVGTVLPGATAPIPAAAAQAAAHGVARHAVPLLWFDRPAPPGRAVTAARIAACGTAAPPDGGWTAGPWLDRPWGVGAPARPAAWRLPRSVLVDGSPTETLHAAYDGVGPNALALAPIGAVLPGGQPPSLASASHIRVDGLARGRASTVTRLDTPAAAGRAVAGGAAVAFGAHLAAPPDDGPWGAGPWAAGPWGDVSAAYVHREESP